LEARLLLKALNNILVFGATSAICHAVLKEFSIKPCNFYLAARNEQRLEAICQDIQSRGGTIKGQSSFDFNRIDLVSECINKANLAMNSIDLILVAHGSLVENTLLEKDTLLALESINANFTSCAAIILEGCQKLETQGWGTLAVISSVAGDRGRKSNYIYGASKSGINTLMQGLRSRFFNTSINIVNIKPGMVDTPMTKNFDKGALWATPESIAPNIYKAISTGQATLYTPGFWRPIMWVIKVLPTSIMSRLPI
jgi:decaprenylphospho-beta-D-erythro-pentofuranosid-2-ulose 2-reductase